MDLRDPWLVAVWPGMGNVALAAGSYLVQQLDVEQLAEYPAPRHFDVEKIQVRKGLVGSVTMPHNRFYGWRNPDGGRDLVIFVGESQPSFRGYAFCRELIDMARGFGAVRVITFAAMVTASHPRSPSRVFSMATGRELLEEVEGVAPGVTRLEQAEITGLNGTLLAAAAAAGLEGLGLLGEVPQIATNVPYLKASQAVLEVFSKLSEVDLEFAELSRKAAAVEHGLADLVKRIQRAVGSQGGPQEAEPTWEAVEEELEDEDEGEGEEVLDEELEEDEDAEEAGVGGLDATTLARIEELFISAARDRERALELKAELDRHGVFKEYEDRFLDLFKSSA